MSPVAFRILSDLHLEFHADGGREFVESLDVQPGEVLLLAGDACSSPMLVGALSRICRRFESVVFVIGNHELYHSDRDSANASLRMVAANFPGAFHVLDKEIVTLNGVRILGCPLWFPKSRANRDAMNDFRQIRDFESWVYEENARCVEFLTREMRPGDVVVTHYLPSWKSVAPEHEGSPLNAFFVCDVERLIAERQPALWVHGHTHSSLDYKIGETRVVCNPFGYLGHDMNPAWKPDLRIEVK